MFQPHVESGPGRDARLAQLLSELTERRRQGGDADIDAVCRQHPELGQELRELWAAAQLADELARAEPATVEWPRPRTGPAPAGTGLPLPRSFGDYELLEEIGRGGMGVVYRARQKSLGRIVALKMILRGELASPADLARFRTEAESAARLQHAHIVPVYEVGEVDGQAYFSMKYVEGSTLSGQLSDGPLPPRQAARYLADIARAVHHAHEQGILHRDLKPSNVLIDGAGVAHVTDFGLAKRVEGGDSLTRTGAIVGTPSYMSPEQAAGSRGTLGPASDVYSLGAILYELLTGRPPFQAPSAVGTIMLVLEQEPVPPRRLNPQVPRELEMICLKCLQKPTDLRYPSAARLADDLEAWLKGEPISARPSGLTYYMVHWLRETPNAPILENWGLLWMWHSLAILILCAWTNALFWWGISSVLPYLGIWTIGFGTWAAVFWGLRRWLGGPVTFVERQVAHIWAAGSVGSVGLFLVELAMGLPVLTLSPILGVFAGMNFIVKAGMLSGAFYVAAAACFVTALCMALVPQIGPLLFGIVSAVCFFVPGYKYYRQSIDSPRLPR